MFLLLYTGGDFGAITGMFFFLHLVCFGVPVVTNLLHGR